MQTYSGFRVLRALRGAPVVGITLFFLGFTRRTCIIMIHCGKRLTGLRLCGQYVLLMQLRGSAARGARLNLWIANMKVYVPYKACLSAA